MKLVVAATIISSTMEHFQQMLPVAAPLTLVPCPICKWAASTSLTVAKKPLLIR